MLVMNDKSASTGGLKTYSKPAITARGNIMNITKGGGLLPGDVSNTLVDGGGGS